MLREYENWKTICNFKKMNLYYIKCLMFRKNNSIKILILRMMLLSNCVVCNSKKSKFIKEQEASEIISSSAKSLSKIPLVGLIMF